VVFGVDKPVGSGELRIRGLKSGQGRFDAYGGGSLAFSDQLAALLEAERTAVRKSGVKLDAWT
jgi:hypothetical protein